MINILIFTTSSLPLEISSRYRILVIPQIINFGYKSFYEGIDIDNPMFMRMLRAFKEIPKTAAPPPELFVHEFNNLVPSG